MATLNYSNVINNKLNVIVAQYGSSSFFKGKRHPLEVTQAPAMGSEIREADSKRISNESNKS